MASTPAPAAYADEEEGRRLRRQEEAAVSRQGEIYVVWAEYTTLFKVGHTRRGVGSRVGEIQPNSPIPLRIVGVWTGSKKDERRLHHKYRNFRQHNEWFNLPEEAVKALLGWDS